MLHALAPDIETAFTEPERLTVAGDEWALVRAGRHSVADYLTLANGFGREHSSGVFGEVSERLMFIHDYLTTSSTRATFEQFVRSLVGPLYHELGIDASPGDDDDRRALRGTVIETLGDAGNDPELASQARSAIERSLSGGTSMDASAAKAAAGVAARHGDSALWDQLMNASQHANAPSERYRYLYALAAFEDPSLVERGLNFALTDDLRSQDTPSYLGHFLENPVARDRAWAFIKEHWAQLRPKAMISGGDLRVAQSLGAFCDVRTRDDIKSFFRTHKMAAASRALDQTIERINNCIAMKDKETAAVSNWLARR